MAFFLVLLIRSCFAWASFVVGSLLNVFLIHVIWKHTPKEMRDYSKILMQTCVTDLLFLLVTLLCDVVGESFLNCF
jgi:hypothetical protein